MCWLWESNLDMANLVTLTTGIPVIQQCWMCGNLKPINNTSWQEKQGSSAPEFWPAFVWDSIRLCCHPDHMYPWLLVILVRLLRNTIACLIYSQFCWSQATLRNVYKGVKNNSNEKRKTKQKRHPQNNKVVLSPIWTPARTAVLGSHVRRGNHYNNLFHWPL